MSKSKGLKQLLTGEWNVCKNNCPGPHAFSIIAVGPGFVTSVCDVYARRWKHGKVSPDPEAEEIANALAALPLLIKGCNLFVKWCENSDGMVDDDTIETLHAAHEALNKKRRPLKDAA